MPSWHTRLLALVLVLTPLCASAAVSMGFDEARQLLNRTSFAADVEDINAFASLTREQAVDRLLSWTSRPVMTAAPPWAHQFESPRRLQSLSEEERRLVVREQVRKGTELRAWWLTEMFTTPSPLTE